MTPERLRQLLARGQGGRAVRIEPQPLYTIPANPYDAENEGQANFEEWLINIQSEPEEAQPWTVTLVGPLPPARDNVATPNGMDIGGPDLFARVKFGAGQFLSEAKIDFVRGTSFTVFASTLTVSAVFPYPSFDGSKMGLVGAYAVPGVRPGGRYPPQRSVRFEEGGGRLAGQLSYEAESTILIPPFARRMRHTLVGEDWTSNSAQQIDRSFLWLDSTAGNPVAIHKYVHASFPAVAGDYNTNLVPQWPDGLDVPRNATRVKLVNQDDGDNFAILQAVAIFELDF